MAKTPADLRSLARSCTEMGVRVLAGIANAEEQPASPPSLRCLTEAGARPRSLKRALMARVRSR